MLKKRSPEETQDYDDGLLPMEDSMSDPNHEAMMNQIHLCESEIDALENKITEADESTTEPKDYAAMRSEQEQHRLRIVESKADIEQGKWSKPKD
jgi:hypothetical protein